jgi:hypothetical protein
MLEFADDVSQRHTTPDEVKTSIPALDELSIHGQPTFSLSYARRTRCRSSAAVPTRENGSLNRVQLRHVSSRALQDNKKPGSATQTRDAEGSAFPHSSWLLLA